MSHHDKEWFSKYREKNRLWLKVYKRRWHHRTKDKRKFKIRDYYIANREKILARGKENNKKRRLEILGLVGLKCVSCGFSDFRALQIDHVKGDGYIERKKTPHSWSYKFWKKALSERPNDYQTLCANCNWIKRIENKEIWNSCVKF